MDFKQFQAFVAVAEEMSFRKAAARLNLSQPPLSMRIKRLEEDIGVELIRRNRNKRIALTVAGEVFLQRAKQTLQAANDAVSHARHAEQGLQGYLAIGHSDDFLDALLPDAISEFRRLYPDVYVSHRQELTFKVEERVRTGDVDLGLVIPPADRAYQEFDVVSLPTTKIVVAVSSRHPLADRKSVELAALRHERFHILPDWGPSNFGDKCQRLFQEAGFQPRMGVIGMSVRLHVELAKRGNGVVLCTESSAPAGVDGISYLEVSSRESALPRAAIFRKESLRPPAANFLGIVADQPALADEIAD